MRRILPLLAPLLLSSIFGCSRTSPHPPPPPRPADLATYAAELERSVPPGFKVVIEAPFVVVGDESESRVRNRASGTVRWAVTHLKNLYFERDPDQILEIWLFKNEQSYQRHTEDIFGEVPHTPFGYYSRRHGALIMNIATGGGTLVHEIVHPYIEANFPDCPSWFNEGLGSLYEQSDSRDGRIVGLTNWRLKGLQDAIRADEVPSFRTLTHTTTREFYDEDKGVHYAAARYLCYYLQEHGLLQRYYREFVARVEQDPTGYETLQAVLLADDMDEFQETWAEWVLELSFP